MACNPCCTGGELADCAFCSGDTPSSMQVVIDGFQKIFLPNSNCTTWSCDDLNGTYILTYVENCTWEYVFPASTAECKALTLRLKIAAFSSFTKLAIEYQNYEGLIFTAFHQPASLQPPDCEDWNNVPFLYSSGPFSSPQCINYLSSSWITSL